MGDILVAVVAAALILIATIAGQIVAWLARRQRAANDPYPFLESVFEFQCLSDRFVVDNRILRYTGQVRGTPCSIELGTGPGLDYARVDFLFDRDLPLGLRISSEYEEGVLTRIMRMREVNIGLHQFDTQFIILSRNEERLKNLLDQDVRRMLLSLRRNAFDVRLNDEGLHLTLQGLTNRETFVAILEEGAQLTSHVFRRGEEILAAEVREREPELAPAFRTSPGTLSAISTDTERSP